MTTASAASAGPRSNSVPDAPQHGTITVRGARTHNLQDVSVSVPKHRLTVFTGVSGSGKSSLVFGTIAAESQRMINETYPAYVQGFMPQLARPDADVLEGLTTAIVVDQERMGGNPRSTVGTATDAHALLRILFSRIAVPRAGGPSAYSFNQASVRGSGSLKVDRGEKKSRPQLKTFERAGGMCTACEGTGQVTDFDLDELLDRSLTIADGAIQAPGYTAGGWNVRLFTGVDFYDPSKPVRDFTEEELQAFLHHEPVRVKVNGINMTFEGLIPRIQGSLLSKERESMQPHVRAFVDRVVSYAPCPSCHGTRLNERARTSLIQGQSIADLCSWQTTDLLAWVRELDEPSVQSLLDSLETLLDSFVQIGLGYLCLDRPAATLSGGEAQRTKMIRHLGSALTDVTYVFDEPTTGLHPHDVQTMNQLLLRLRDKGNTVLVVEHQAETIRAADWVVDLGPGAGVEGGQITYCGDVAGLRASGTATGASLDQRLALKEDLRTATGAIRIQDAAAHNLRNVSVEVPTGVLVAVTGVAGSGKSSLVRGSLGPREEVVLIDQSPIKGSRRSHPATWTGMLEPIRKAFAKANGVKASLFSSNSDGACPACSGSGVLYTDLSVMAEVATPCEECQGRRYAPEVLEHRLGGKDIAEVLDLSVDQALEFFSEGEARIPAAAKILRRMQQTGLGYLRIGQSLTTLSGGERQRLKLAAQLGEQGEVLVLDEPTAGLHPADVRALLAMLDELVEAGKSVVVIEHHLAVMAHADWIIDLGPGAGQEGGEVVFEGTPAQLVAQGRTLTAQYLARAVGRRD